MLSTLEISREDLKFSVAHFTIFSATERETLHGHNYYVQANITAKMQEDISLPIDYRIIRKEIKALCKALSMHTLLPAESPYLLIEESESQVKATFNQNEVMVFPRKDVLLMPMKNISAEALAQWFIKHMIEDQAKIRGRGVSAIEIKISTTAGQNCSVVWENSASEAGTVN